MNGEEGARLPRPLLVAVLGVVLGTGCTVAGSLMLFGVGWTLLGAGVALLLLSLFGLPT